MPTKQTEYLQSIGGFTLYVSSTFEGVYGYENFYVDAEIVSTNAKSNLTIFTSPTSILGAFEVFCYAENVPDEGETIDVKLSVKNRKLEELGIQWGESFAKTIVISRDDKDIFDYSINDDKVRIRGFNTNDEELIIPETIDGYPVTEVGYTGGSQHKNIKKIVFPKNMKEYNSIIFCMCPNLEEISINGVKEYEENNKFVYAGNCLAYHEDDQYNLVLCTNKLTYVPDIITKIDHGAFSWRKLTELTIGQGVKDMVELDLYKSTINSLKVAKENPYFTSQINGTEYNAVFSKSEGSENFDTLFCAINTTTDIPDSAGIKYIHSHAYADCGKKTSIVLPDTIEEFGNNCFDECYLLESINIPNKVTEISSGLFQECRSLKSINIPKSVTRIGQYPFRNCQSLETITYTGDTWANSCSINDYAFENCTSLKSFELAPSVNYIDPDAFKGCTALESLTVNADNKTFYSKVDDVESNCIISKSLGWIFAGCSKSKIPTNENVTGICTGAFSGLPFTTFTIPANIIYIFGYAFNHCNQLEELIVEGADTDTWTGYKTFSEEEGTDVTKYMQNTYLANITINLFSGEGGHVTRKTAA